MRTELIPKLKGVLVPIVTPMKQDGALNLETIPFLVDYLIEGNVSVIIPCGSTGEFPSLTIDERKRVIKATIDAVNGRAIVIAGISDTNTRNVIDLADFTRSAGGDGVLITAPYYYLPSDEEVFIYFHHIDRAIDIPFMFYNNPGTTKFNASFSLIERLSHLDNFAAMKETNSTPVRYYEEVQRFADIFPVIPAGEPSAIFNIIAGAPGFMSVAANFNPKLISDLLHAAKEKRISEAFAYFDTLREYREIFEDRNRLGYPLYVIFAKAALDILGFAVGPPRPPLLPPSDEDRKRLRKVLKHTMGLL